jgi:hypothetical protein
MSPLPKIKRTVLVESPFKAPTLEETERNIRYVRAAMLDCLRRNEAPFASHALYTIVLDDTDPADRALGIAAGLELGARLDVTVVYLDLGISDGMKLGIEAATAAGRPIEYRSLPAWSNLQLGPA